MRERHILSDLAGTPPHEIKAELDDVQAEIAQTKAELDRLNAQMSRLQVEEGVLAQMLRLRQWDADGVPGAGETIVALQATAPEQKRANVSANVLTVILNAERPLAPQEVQQRLQEVGVRADTNSIRVALRRWADRGRLIKDGRFYVSAPAAEGP